MGDFSEFRLHWRPLLASFIGMGAGLAVNAYILNIFAPYFLEDFGWSRSQWALLGMAQMLIMICLPIAGRLTDMFGVRRVAAVGALSYPVFLVLIAAMDGDIRVYAAIYVAQTVVCSTTTSTVYSRVVAAAFKVRRGLALGICGSSPPLVGAVLAPVMTAFVAEHGWRTGYLLVAAFCALGAIVTLLLLAPHDGTRKDEADAGRPVGVYRTIFAMPAFWLILIAAFLVNVPFTLAVSQLKMVVLEQGLPDTTAALLVSTFAVSSIAGRVISGVALDYLPSHIIAGICYGLPFAGLLMLASPMDGVGVVTLAIALIGLSFGAEGDIIPYLVTRYFGIAIYSTVLGMVSAAMGLAMGSGNALLGAVLAATDSFDAYLFTAAAATLIGAIMFLMLGHRRFARHEDADGGL